GARLKRLFFTSERAVESVKSLAQRAAARHIDVYEVDARTLAALTETETPQGLVAVAEFPEHPIREIPKFLSEDAPTIVLILHDIADPGNAGVLVRSAEAFGARAVCFGPNAVEPYNDKLVRASAGALFRIALFTYDAWSECAAAARKAKLTVVAADSAAPDVSSVTIDQRVALVIGHERHGLRDIPVADIGRRAGIPQAQHADSLNAGVAGSIMLYEISRSTGVMGLMAREHQSAKSQAL
ncbi:MAG TPA: RNA methyltransferase, partial [Candidatus Eremiobacteraceae bacterium]|nr:RNA methyltransferase [Candidatus Eremiobacteraceae bacterium]